MIRSKERIEIEYLKGQNKTLKNLYEVMQRDFNILYEKLGRIKYVLESRETKEVKIKTIKEIVDKGHDEWDLK